jgi:hypothetical protein
MTALLLAAALTSQTPAARISDDICYDLAIVGRIRHYENFVGLDRFLQLGPNELAFGGRFDVDIDVDKVLAGNLPPTGLQARVVLTTEKSPKARMLMLLKYGPVEPDRDNTVRAWDGGYFPRASKDRPWSVLVVRSANRVELADPSLPPRCR